MCCPVCHKPMRMIAVIDNREVIEKILHHLSLWSGPLPTLATARPPHQRNAITNRMRTWTRCPITRTS
jgi:hypothetical protein